MNHKILKDFPRLPLDGKLDLTYRCNNNCRHCWLWLPNDISVQTDELSMEEITHIVDEARQMGCQSWYLSGGEPMLRPEFPDIFDYITRKSISYTLNTNGTLITPKIAKLLTRPGKIMVALYGATAEINDHVTRNPGSFDATMRGIAYLKEAGARFIIQIIPMRANYHQYEKMVKLSQSLSPHYRHGAAWLWLSANHCITRNQEIISQRLTPAELLKLDKPVPTPEHIRRLASKDNSNNLPLCDKTQPNERLFASCINSRRDFHIDPYGQMSFCCFIKDPALRYDLRQGSFHEAWDHFIPSLAEVVIGDQEYLENCGSCDLRSDCRWCPVYSYLEHGRYTAKVEYLCEEARAKKRFKEIWMMTHLRYYQIAGMTIQLTADFPITDETFAPRFNKFRVDGPSEDMISIRLVSGVPERSELRLDQEVYRKPPWAIYKQRDSWVYLGVSDKKNHPKPFKVAILSKDHNKMTICCNLEFFRWNNLHSLTTFPSDQILLAQVLANRQACFIHASGFIMDHQGLLFVGHSNAGKSTMLKMLRGYGEILCDDRMIVRRWPDGFRIHGSWSHGELPDVSPASAPLKAIFYLEQASVNELIPITNEKERLGKMLSHVVRPLMTSDWWEKTLELADKITTEVPAYRLRFDLSGDVVDLLKKS
jgi:MoaA/NifB/PqqE/SkfB family radical SAM enzyme